MARPCICINWPTLTSGRTKTRADAGLRDAERSNHRIGGKPLTLLFHFSNRGLLRLELYTYLVEELVHARTDSWDHATVIAVHLAGLFRFLIPKLL